MRLSAGHYAVVDGILYRRPRRSTTRSGTWSLEALDPGASPRQRELDPNSPALRHISPSASYRGVRLYDLIFSPDGVVDFVVYDYPGQLDGKWPGGMELEKYGMPERAGDGFWYGTIPLSELEEFDDGIPDEWRPFLPKGDVDDAG